MKNRFFLLVIFLFSLTVSSQNNTNYVTVEGNGSNKERNAENRFFQQYELNTSIIGNTESDDPNTSFDESRPWFLANGLGFKYGLGVHKNKWLSLSAHTGFDWKANERLVAVPVYGNISLSPLLGDDVRLVLQTGLGRGFAVGRGNMQGKYQKYSLGFESDANDFGLFIEVSSYRFNLHYNENTLLFNIGGYIKTF
ncbi:hypothetical protein [Flavobacterium luminosum]|uniref:Uncharacterized protein n=1 Tax=Flavobacterium luminosum TaxID=2949086 RepID=A0ABT0TN70_9FLAO|nr:hypothetical protein [Flavobacterium sp. HXWNR70]MCL9808333.1 hypothetical protein [Flavobacterium sp. HXWNR70]